VFLTMASTVASPRQIKLQVYIGGRNDVRARAEPTLTVYVALEADPAAAPEVHHAQVRKTGHIHKNIRRPRTPARGICLRRI
jgi:hypothetical protein